MEKYLINIQLPYIIQQLRTENVDETGNYLIEEENQN